MEERECRSASGPPCWLTLEKEEDEEGPAGGASDSAQLLRASGQESKESHIAHPSKTQGPTLRCHQRRPAREACPQLTCDS